MTRNSFEKCMNELYNDVIAFAALVENAVYHTIKAIESKDEALMKEVILNDEIINQKDAELEQKCLDIIVTQQPLAKDLRLIVSIMKMTTDFERIGDNAADICALALELKENMDAVSLLTKMTAHAVKTVKTAIDSYILGDIEAARSIKDMEEKLDCFFSDVIVQIEQAIKKNPERTNKLIRLLFIAKYLERIGDHASNVGEWAIFNKTGAHEKLN